MRMNMEYARAPRIKEFAQFEVMRRKVAAAG